MVRRSEQKNFPKKMHTTDTGKYGQHSQLLGNTDKNHLFPILSSVEQSDLLMGMKSKHHLCQPEERSSYDFC